MAKQSFEAFKSEFLELAISDYGLSENDFYPEEIQQAYSDNETPQEFMDYLAKKYDLQNINDIP